MSKVDPLDEDQPLDPEVEAIRRKMVRLLAVSISIMVVGLMAVFGAILYKVKTPKQVDVSSQTASGAPIVATEVNLPTNARLISTSLNGDRILLTIELADKQRQLQVYDLTSNRIIATINISQ